MVRSHILVCGGTGCHSNNSGAIKKEFETLIKEKGLENEVAVIGTGCFGLCAVGPIVIVYPEGAFYSGMRVEDVGEIIDEHIVKGRLVQRLLYKEKSDQHSVKALSETNFYKKQTRVALRNCGVINPEEIDEYIAFDGYQALIKCLTELTPQQVIDIIKASGLRGRGGGGFPTGLKWQFAANSPGEIKYVCCNADEGDPGAFMDRSILEGDPHAVLEAMAIAGYAIGAHQGYIYVRAEYPIAVQRLKIALKQAKEYGLLGKNILDTGFDFDLDIRLGAGAFVCGEETALMTSIEGHRGEPRPRPPFPAVKGLFGKPTILNNVETYANIPPIILRGAEWFSSIGTEKIDLMQIKELLQAHLSGEAEEERRAAAAAIESEKRRKAEKVSTQSSGDALIIDEKIGQLDYKLAKCCNPIHGDEIFGFITVGAGITIHRTDCPNAQRLRRNYPYRVLEARWRDEAQGAFRVSIRVVASDTTGMINHIAEVINRDLKLSIRSMNLSPGGGLLSGVIHVEVPGTGMVDMLIHSILRIKGVQKAYRVNN